MCIILSNSVQVHFAKNIFRGHRAIIYKIGPLKGHADKARLVMVRSCVMGVC